jgi:hypothetical protein
MPVMNRLTEPVRRPIAERLGRQPSVPNTGDGEGDSATVLGVAPSKAGKDVVSSNPLGGRLSNERSGSTSASDRGSSEPTSVKVSSGKSKTSGSASSGGNVGVSPQVVDRQPEGERRGQEANRQQDAKGPLDSAQKDGFGQDGRDYAHEFYRP